MHPISRRGFLKATGSAAAFAVGAGPLRLMASTTALPLGLQLYSVRDLLPKDYEGTLRQLAALGYREVEAAGFFDRSASAVKQAMDRAGLRCVSAHYPLAKLLPEVEKTIDFAKSLGLNYIVCSSPMRKDQAQGEGMTLEDWRWNAEQFNRIGEQVSAAGMRFAYHNHTPEFRSENGVVFYDELLRLTDPAKLSMELDCGWAVVAGKSPVEYLSKYPNRFSMLHVKDFKLTPSSSVDHPPPSTELGHGTIDYRPIFEAAKKADIQHAFVEQEDFDLPALEALKIDAEYMSHHDK